MKLKNFVLESDGSTKLLNAVSEAIKLKPAVKDAPIPLTIYGATSPVGSIEGILAANDAEAVTGAAGWVPILGGDLALFQDGGAVELSVKFTHIRINLIFGSCYARLGE